MSYRQKYFVSVSLIILSVLFGYLPSFADWQTATVATGKGPLDIAVDSNGRAHIAYSADTYYGSLDYATNATGSWTSNNLAPLSMSVQVGVYNSIAVDSNGKAHISYINSNNTLNYAENTSGSWIKTEGLTTSSGVTGMAVSIAVDSNNKEHIAYIDRNVYGKSCLKYTTNTTGSWVTSTVGTCDSTSYAAYPSIAVDSSTKVHIGYTGLSGLQYATNISGSWITSTVDSGGGGYTSIAVDSNNKAHISYRTTYVSNNILKYATNTSGTWVITTLDNSEGTSTMAVDSNNKILRV